MPLVIEERVGSLFSSTHSNDAVSLVHCVACDLRMNRGIARQFQRRFGGLAELRKQAPWPGKVLMLPIASPQPRFVFCLVTKTQSARPPADAKAFMLALCRLREHVASHDIRHLAMPRIGCGFDGMRWPKVKRLLETAFRDMDVHITVCAPPGK
jgi:O-acetyl-ADP-ribose deacetylase (regulator of RNase III)